MEISRHKSNSDIYTHISRILKRQLFGVTSARVQFARYFLSGEGTTHEPAITFDRHSAGARFRSAEFLHSAGVLPAVHCRACIPGYDIGNTIAGQYEYGGRQPRRRRPRVDADYLAGSPIRRRDATCGRARRARETPLRRDEKRRITESTNSINTRINIRN